MKQYIASNQLRLIGKGWEIRHQLKKLASAGDDVLLSQFTRDLPPVKATLGGSPSSLVIKRSDTQATIR